MDNYLCNCDKTSYALIWDRRVDEERHTNIENNCLIAFLVFYFSTGVKLHGVIILIIVGK